MEVVGYIATCALLLYAVYKFVDFLIRIPRVGNYQDRYIFITGCDTGFGNAIAKRLDQLGCHVFAGCLTEKGESELKKVSSERLHVISLDVTKKESVRKALEYVKSKLPPGRGLWGVLNNAGVLSHMGPPDWLTVDDYKEQCEVNLWGLIDVTLTFLPLVKKESGRVVNTSSIAGRLVFNVGAPYSISKYGVEAFTDALRRTIYYFGCKASLIEPGVFRTAITLTMRPAAEKAWRNASPQIKAEYGEAYAEYVIGPLVDQLMKMGYHPISKVVDAYEHAILARFPRARYLVGLDSKCAFILLQTLPEWLSDWIWGKLLTGCPLPSAAKKS